MDKEQQIRLDVAAFTKQYLNNLPKQHNAPGVIIMFVIGCFVTGSTITTVALHLFNI